MADETRAQLEALEREWSSRKDALVARVLGLAREGHDDAAATLLDAHATALRETFTPARLQRLAEERITVYQSERSFRDVARNLRRRAELSARASRDYGAAQQLLLELVEQKPYGFLLPPLPLSHPRVQSVLDALREQHEETSRLFSGRSVRLELECDRFQPDFHRRFTLALASALQPLGLQASADGGDERLLVRGVLDGPDSAHYVDDDACMGTLEVTATWEGSGLGVITFSETAVGSEEAGDFADRLLAGTARTFPLELLKTWATSPGFKA